MVMREVDEDLAIFLGMRNAEKERSDHHLVEESDEFNDSKGRNFDVLNPCPSESEINPVVADDSFLKVEVEMGDYDWLLMQADTSLLPSGETDSLVTNEISNGEGIPLKSQLANELLAASAGAHSGNTRPLSSEDQRRTPTLCEKPKPTRASTPTPRVTFPSSKPQARSSTPTTSASRSSTPACRASVSVSMKSAPRSATPTRTPLTTASRKTGSTMSKNPSSTRGASPIVKSRPLKPSEMPSLSRDGPQNPKASTVRRPASASRGRAAAPVTHSASSNGKPRQKSCSPAKVRGPTSNAYKSGSKILSRSRAHGSDGDDVNPVLMGTKMVHRVVNMRKLAPPRQDEYVPHDNHRKSSHENSGFGRSLSKNSLDMAIRHMDIGLGIADRLRPVATSAVSSTRSSQSHSFHKSGAVGASESPPLSSCDSSKSSICINSHFLNGTELDD